MATITIKSTEQSAIVDTIAAIQSLANLTHEIIEVAQTICATGDELRDPILYDLLMYTKPQSIPAISGYLMNIACVANDHVFNKRAPTDAARRLFPLISEVTSSDARVMDTFREAIARERVCITADTLAFVHNCAPLSEREFAKMAESMPEPRDSCEGVDEVVDCTIDMCSGAIMSNYPDETFPDRGLAFTQLYKKFARGSIESETIFNLIKIAHDLHMLVNGDPKFVEHATSAIRHIRCPRASDA